MIGRLRGWLAAALTLPVLLSGCTYKTETPTAPEVLEPPGTLVGVSYSYCVGMVWGDDFEIMVGPGRIRWMRCFSLEEGDYIEVENVSIDDSCWKEIEERTLALFPRLEEYRPVEETPSFWDKLFGTVAEEAMVLDGGDKTSFNLIWETPEGTVTIVYHWNSSNEGAMELVEGLRALAEINIGKGE